MGYKRSRCVGCFYFRKIRKKFITGMENFRFSFKRWYHLDPCSYLWYKYSYNLKHFQISEFTSQEFLPLDHSILGWSFPRIYLQVEIITKSLSICTDVLTYILEKIILVQATSGSESKCSLCVFTTFSIE